MGSTLARLLRSRPGVWSIDSRLGSNGGGFGREVVFGHLQTPQTEAIYRHLLEGPGRGYIMVYLESFELFRAPEAP